MARSGGWVGDENEERLRLIAAFKSGGFAASAAPRRIWDEAHGQAMMELRSERERYRGALQEIAQHDWQEIAVKCAELEAVVEFIDIAKEALNG